MDLTGVVAAAVAEAGITEADSGDAVMDSPVESGESGADVDTSSGDTDGGDSGDTGDDSSAVSADASAAPADAPEPTPAPAPSDEDELKALEAELTAKTPTLNKGKIPASRHQAVLTRERRKHEAALKELQERYAPYEDPAVKQRLQAFQLAETDPALFVERLVQHPAFAPHVQRLTKAQQAEVAKASPAPAAPVDLVAPKPDKLNDDGTLGYSPEQAQKFAEYQVAVVRRELAAEIAALKSTVNPIVEERRASENARQLIESVTPILETARARWADFATYEADIQAYMDRPDFPVGLSAKDALERAYDAVVPARRKVDQERREAELRASWTKELNERAKAQRAAAPGALPAATGRSGPKTIEDIVREQAMRLQEAEV